MVSFAGGKCTVYETDGTVKDLTEEAKGDTGSINLPKSDAYANEIRYFTDCVLENRFPDKVKAEELGAVIRILKEI